MDYTEDTFLVEFFRNAGQMLKWVHDKGWSKGLVRVECKYFVNTRGPKTNVAALVTAMC